jgi:hypothetical protein
MQVLIVVALVSLVSAAFGSGEFNAKIQLHSQVLAAAREAIRQAGAAEARFNDLISNCKPENIKNQTTLLDCGSQFSSLSGELGKFKFYLEAARSSIQNLPPDFAPSKAALGKALDKSAVLVDTSSEVARKLSQAFFAGNGVLLDEQFNQAGRSHFIKSKTKYFCTEFQTNSDQQVYNVRASLERDLSFGALYMLFYRVQNTLLIASTVARFCRREFHLAELTNAFEKLQLRLTTDRFFAFRHEVCQRAPSTSCENLPWTPYSVYWLSSEGSRP